ncbi:retropepsin-like aspartic protease [Ekhidna sp. MALMAid0563]|uniref:retropepsin-like aspartic protease n=1 Tax=Ekhidna sp. MALMAid0563 TaxID=3143937 RepID=UPI0032DFAF38
MKRSSSQLNTLALSLIMVFSAIQANAQFDPSEYSTLDFELHKNLIIVNAHINEKPAKFIVDTGASISLLDKSQYKRYEFKYSVSTDERLTGFGGKSRLMKTSSVKFKLDGFDLAATYRFNASDLGDLNVALSDTNQRVLGILGSDFLKNYHAIIDYEKQKIYVKFLY